MPLYFITGNKNKLAELQEMIPDVEQLDIELPEIQDIDPHEIIKAKLTEALKHHDGPIIVEDTSLMVDEMNGLPGPFIKWFLQALGYEGIQKIVSSLSSNKAKAQALIGYAKDVNEIKFFKGIVEGEIVAPRGAARFGWDPIFQPKGFAKTFAEMTPEEKNSISHRKVAVEKLKKFLGK